MPVIYLFQWNNTRVFHLQMRIVSFTQFFSCQHLVGRLIYLIVTRPDIIFSMHVLSRFMHEPRTMHMDVALRVFQYLKLSLGKGILLSSTSDLCIRGYCDAD